MDNEKWMKDLRERFGDYSAPVPEDLWDGVLAGTNRKKIIAAPFWKIASGVAAVAAAVAIAVVTPLRMEEKSTDVQDPVKVAVNDADVTEPPVFDVLADASTGASFVPRKTIAKASVKTVEAPVYQQSEIVPQSIIEPVNEVVSEPSPDSVPEPETVKDEPENIKDEPKITKDEPEFTKGEPQAKNRHDTGSSRTATPVGVSSPAPVAKSSSRKFSIGITGSNPSQAASTSTGYGVSPVLTRAAAPSGVADGKSDVMLFSANKPTTTSEHHYMPLNVGVTFNYNFTDRLSVGTGLVYSRLVSSFRSGTDNNYCDISQTVNYIGIPVTLRYDFLKWKFLDLYSSIGGMFQKCVSATQESVYSHAGSSTKDGPEGMGDGNIVWSATAGAGVQLNATKWLGFFAEPGFTYHFRNNSSISTVYSARPADFSLLFGVRFSFR